MLGQYRVAARPGRRGVFSTSLLVVFLLASCGEPSVMGRATPGSSATPRTASATPVATPVGTFALPGADSRLVALRTTSAMAIWESYGTPFGAYVSNASYALMRSEDGFAGRGQFEVTGYRMGGGGRPVLTHTNERQVSLPLSAAASFLQQLASIPPLQGTYSPPPKPTHSAHQIGITLETDAGSVEFAIDPYPAATPFTTVKHAGISWPSISRQPLDALEAVEPYLLRATLQALEGRVTSDVRATQVAIPTPTPVPPTICRTMPPATPIPPAGSSGVPTPTVLAPGAPVRLGDTINLAVYFGLPRPGTRPISVAPDGDANFEDLTIRDSQRIAAITAALDRPAIVVAHPRTTTGRGAILLMVDLFGKSLGLGYFSQDELIAFSVDGESFAIAAPPEFRAVLVQQLCQK